MKRRLVRAGGVFLGLSMLWYGGGHLAAALYGAYAVRTWEQRLGPLADVEARFPMTPNSPAALELSRLASALGIDFRTGTSSEPLQMRLPELDRYLESRLENQPLDTDLEERVASALADHRAAIDEVRSHLLGAAEIRWETDIARGYDAPIPSMMAFRRLAGVLVADALLADRRGDAAAADQSLLAAWALADSLRSRGELITQLMVVNLDMRVLRALQRVSSAAPEWGERVASHDARRALIRSAQLEAWLWRGIGSDLSVDSFAWMQTLALAADEAVDHRSPAVRWLADPLVRPYFLLCSSNTLLAGKRLVEALESADACGMAAPEGQALEPEVPWWNLLGQIVMPSLTRAYTSAVHHALTAELTGKVLRARASRSSEGRWPGAASEPSAVCASWRWVSELGPEGELTLSLDGDPLGPGGTPALSFRSGVAPGGPRQP